MTNPPIIVPRWEWRCFAPSLASVARVVPVPPASTPKESDEIYLLDLTRTENAKIRDGVLDIKRLREVDDHGLELWEPVFKSKLPLQQADLIRAFEAFGVRIDAAPRDTCSLDQLIDEVIAPRSDFRVVRVHKSRRGFTFDGCISEFATITLAAEKIALESFSLEAEDPECILAALRLIGMDSHTNTSYPAGLKRALGIAPSAAREAARHAS